MAHYLGLSRYRDADWERVRAQVDPAIGDLFEAPAAAPQDRGRLPVPGPVPAAPAPLGAPAD
jgi:hypothetical protein